MAAIVYGADLSPCPEAHNDTMESITLISGKQTISCTGPVYYARHDSRMPARHYPSHLVAWPDKRTELDAICYIQLARERVPVLVSRQADGCIWIGGAYLDTIARELRLIPRPLPDEMAEKTKEWLEAIGDRWQIPDPVPIRDNGKSPEA